MAALVTTSQFTTDPSLTDTFNKMWRTEIRPATQAASNQRMTVFDLAPSSSQVASATPVTIVSGPAVGTVLQSSTGNSVVVSGTAPVGTAIAGTLSYVVPAAQTRHVITDLTPSTGYTISVVVSGTNHSVEHREGREAV